MPKNKLRKFSEFRLFPNTFEFAYENKGNWRDHFQNGHPIVLELGCGKGEYTTALARHYPDKNHIGIDLKSNRMWKGASVALDEKLTNVAFIRCVIDKITELFDQGEVDEIWITFPDPFPKDRHAKRRLTSPDFLDRYQKILKPGGTVHFKTDDDALFEYTLGVLHEKKITPGEVIKNVHADSHAHDMLRNIRTYYEQLFMGRGRTIKYLNFQFN